MSTIQIKRGLEASRLGYTPLLGEFLWTTDNKDLWVGDGTTAGGLKATGNIETNYIPNTAIDAVNGVAGLDGTGLIPFSLLPAIAITSTTVVATEVAQLALTAQEGDVAVRSDENKSYIHNGGVAGTMADWTLLATPTDVVLSVNSQTGAITLDTDNIDEGVANFYFTDTRAQSAVIDDASAVSSTTGYSASKIEALVGAITITSIDDIGDVDTTTVAPSVDDILKWNGTNWVPSANVAGITTILGLTDTPAAYTGAGGYKVKVNVGETALEFVADDIDGGTF